MKKSGLIALGAMLVAGSALASNTGFKLNYPLQYVLGRSNQNWISFPTFYFPNGNVSVSQQNAQDVCNDLNDFASPPAKVQQLVQWKPLTETPLIQTCGGSKLAFNIVAGESYAAVPPAASIVVNIVGSNNDLYAPNKGGTSTYPLQFVVGRSNQNWVSVPYHTTADNSIDLCNQWSNQTSNNIVQAVQWKTLTETPLIQTCGGSKLAFNVTPGEGYAVVPRIAGQAISWNVY